MVVFYGLFYVSGKINFCYVVEGYIEDMVSLYFGIFFVLDGGIILLFINDFIFNVNNFNVFVNIVSILFIFGVLLMVMGGIVGCCCKV